MHTLFFHQPDVANKEDAIAIGYLSLKDIVNSDFKETNSWFHLETRDEVWTLLVSDNEKRASIESKEAVPDDVTKAKAWYSAICRYLQDQPRDITEVLRAAEEEIRQRQAAKLAAKEEGVRSKSTSAAAVPVDTSSSSTAVTTASGQGAKRWCCCG